MPDSALAGTGTEVASEDEVREVELTDQDQDNQSDCALEDHVAPEQRHSHIVLVVGSEEAKGRGQQPAYSREVFTREVVFPCIVCKQTVTQQRYPGNLPLYCRDACKGERQRDRTRERVALHRKRKKADGGNNSSQETVPV